MIYKIESLVFHIKAKLSDPAVRFVLRLVPVPSVPVRPETGSGSNGSGSSCGSNGSGSNGSGSSGSGSVRGHLVKQPPTQLFLNRFFVVFAVLLWNVFLSFSFTVFCRFPLTRATEHDTKKND